MKAFLVQKYKRPLALGDLPEPTVGARDVLVDIQAAGVNLIDAKVRDGEFKAFLTYKAPIALGHDLAGVVMGVGAEVTRFSVGDEVYARPRDGRIGTFAQRIAVDEDDVAAKPARLSMIEAASAPLVALTAWQALIELAGLKPGQKVLIQAGSGGVGTVAIQLAKHLGAFVATTTGTSNVEWVRKLGADLVIDYKTQDFTEHVVDYDVVLDSQGGDTLMRSLGVLKPGGIAIGIAGPPDPAFARKLGRRFALEPVMALLSFKVRRAARRHRVRYSFLFMRASGAQLGEITKLIDAGEIRPVVERAYPFDQAPQALAHVESGRAKGKVVVTVG